MTLIYPEAGDGSSDKLLSEAHGHFADAANALSVFIAALKAGDTTQAPEAMKLVKELKAALVPALMERERLEKTIREDAGVVNGYAIDFDAARHEIGRRLACLRAARGAGGVSE
ncbi:hypothetical protein [Qingshengfaniella alkalisoli]|uniref:Uncharacterized protein n=1 Tax=Qingshengfaniella alkalisoli TaxID=2599296 RepID=A0A5B8I8D9_9RHOB|nr:hypothetical protein [Qingshengfaniella alkalisoli]QDY68916.1 hypothetical protein FPZ52_04220 [Qingshengfaniella alkalisoli]